MKTSKVIAVLVIIAIAMGLFVPGTVFALSSSEFYQWLADSGIPEYSVSGAYRANYGTFVKYDLVVYGNTGDVPGNELRQGEYRYLGYTYLEGRYTNLDFPNDETGNTGPEEWDYVDVSGAAESWDSLEQTVQCPYMLHTPLNGHGAVSLTAADIGTSKAKVQSAASWNSSGSIYTYKSNAFYATFTVPSMGKGILTASMTPDDSIIYVDEGDTGLDTGVTLIASVNKPADEVDFIKVVFTCGDWRKVRYFHNTNSINIHQDADLALPVQIPGSVKIDAKVTSESIFGDKLEKNLSCTISVRSGEGSSVATPVPSSNPVPEPTPDQSSQPTSTPRPPAPTSTPAPYIPPNPVWPVFPTEEPGNPDPGGDEPGDNGNNGGSSIFLITAGVSGSWNHWESQSHRFLALEEIHLNVWVLGRAESAVIRLSPQLESMTYTNSAGHTYDYCDDFFGYEVSFPQDSTLDPSGGFLIFSQFEWTYSLPMCDETLSWEGDRLRPSYCIYITVYDENGDPHEHVIDDIEITGNIYELLYPQPL